VKRAFILVLLSVEFVTGIAQNLVPNPGFEELLYCPHSFSTDRKDFKAPGWNSPTRGTPDLFHACSWGEADVPYNWAGSSNAHSGKGYAGIYVWSHPNESRNYREYIQCRLAEPLQAGKSYRLEFYFKLASNSVYAANRIGLALSNEEVNLSHDQVIDRVPVLSVEKDTAITVTTGSWELAAAEVVAAGGEQYLIIGNFFDNQSTKSTRLPHRIGKNHMLTHSAYYYIDDVSVAQLDPEVVHDTVPIAEFDGQKIEVNRLYILKNIQFEFDSHVLLRASYEELNKVVNYLVENKDIAVHLSGHTDFIGSDEYNLKLSRARSRSVADYLISMGISADRITTYGFGKSRPLRTEKTDEARSINRRVEIRFID
jgi:outer membrane protein OmpA-like peptidoglycan-associated protein